MASSVNTSKVAYGLCSEGMLFPPLSWSFAEGSSSTITTVEATEVKLKQKCDDFIVFEIDSDGVLVGGGEGAAPTASPLAKMEAGERGTPAVADGGDADHQQHNTNPIVSRWLNYSHPMTAPSAQKSLMGVASASEAMSKAVAQTVGSNDKSQEEEKEAVANANAVEEQLIETFKQRGLPLAFDVPSSSSAGGAGVVALGQQAQQPMPPPPLPLSAIFPCICPAADDSAAVGGSSCACGMRALQSRVRDYAFAVLCGYKWERICNSNSNANSNGGDTAKRHAIRGVVLSSWAKALLPTDDYETFVAEGGYVNASAGGAPTNRDADDNACTDDVAATAHVHSIASLAAASAAGLPMASFGDKVMRSFVRIALRYRYPYLDCHTFTEGTDRQLGTASGGLNNTNSTAAINTSSSSSSLSQYLTLLPNDTFLEHCALFGATHPNFVFAAGGGAAGGGMPSCFDDFEGVVNTNSTNTNGNSNSSSSSSVEVISAASLAHNARYRGACAALVGAIEGVTRLTRASLIMTIPPYMMMGVPEELRGGGGDSHQRSGGTVPSSAEEDTVMEEYEEEVSESDGDDDDNASTVAAPPPAVAAAPSTQLDAALEDELSYWLGGGGGAAAAAAAKAAVAPPQPQPPAPNLAPRKKKVVTKTRAVAKQRHQQSTAGINTAGINSSGSGGGYRMSHAQRTAGATAVINSLCNPRQFPAISLTFANGATKDDRAAFHEGCRRVYGVGWRKTVASGVLVLSIDRGFLAKVLSVPSSSAPNGSANALGGKRGRGGNGAGGGDAAGDGSKQKVSTVESSDGAPITAATTATSTSSTSAAAALSSVMDTVYTHFIVFKANIDFLELKDALAAGFTHHPVKKASGSGAVGTASRRMKHTMVLPNAVTVAGIKDKMAITAQRTSVKGDFTYYNKQPRVATTAAAAAGDGGAQPSASPSSSSSLAEFVGIDWAVSMATGTASAASALASDPRRALASARASVIRKVAALIVGMDSAAAAAGDGESPDGSAASSAEASVEALAASMIADPSVQLLYHEGAATGGGTNSVSGGDNNDEGPFSPSAAAEPSWILLTHPALRSYPIGLGDLKGNRFLINASVVGRGRGSAATKVEGAVLDAASVLKARVAAMGSLLTVEPSKGNTNDTANTPSGSGSVAFPNHFGTQRFGLVGGVTESTTIHSSTSTGTEGEGSAAAASSSCAVVAAAFADPLMARYACRSPSYLARLTKHAGIYMLQGNYSMAADALLFYGAMGEGADGVVVAAASASAGGGSGSGCASSSASPLFTSAAPRRSVMVDKLQQYLLLTGNFAALATGSRVPDPRSLTEAYARAHPQWQQHADHGCDGYDEDAAAPFNPPSTALRYVQCQRLAATNRDATLIISKLNSSIKSARLGGSSATSSSGASGGLMSSLLASGGGHGVSSPHTGDGDEDADAALLPPPSPFILSPAAAAFRANNSQWEAICRRAVLSIPFSLRQLWMHAAQSLVYNHMLSAAVASERQLLVKRSPGCGDGGVNPEAEHAEGIAVSSRVLSAGVTLPLLGRLALPPALSSSSSASSAAIGATMGVDKKALCAVLVQAATTKFAANRTQTKKGTAEEEGDEAAVSALADGEGEVDASAMDPIDADADGLADGAAEEGSNVPLASRKVALLSSVLATDVAEGGGGLDPNIFFYDKDAVVAEATGGGPAVAPTGGDASAAGGGSSSASTTTTTFSAASIVATIAAQRATRAAAEVCGVSLIPHARPVLATARHVRCAVVDGSPTPALTHIAEGGGEDEGKEEVTTVLPLSLSFSLPSAAYATVFLMHLLGRIPK